MRSGSGFDGELVQASALQSGRPFLTVEARPIAKPTRQAGFTNYFGAHPGGGISLSTVMCDYSLAEAELTCFDVAPDAPAWLRSLKPRVLLPYVVRDMAITISEVRRHDEPPDETLATHLRLRLLKTFSTQVGVIGIPAVAVHFRPPSGDPADCPSLGELCPAVAPGY